MKTIDQPAVLEALRTRLKTLTPDTAATWGKMNAHQMLLHCGEAMERVVRGEEFPKMPGGPSKFIKFIALKTSLDWPKGLPTSIDPAAVEVDVEGFEEARARTVRAMEELASAEGSGFSPSHPAFGAMNKKDWLRWAQRHLDHHLRQFGV